MGTASRAELLGFLLQLVADWRVSGRELRDLADLVDVAGEVRAAELAAFRRVRPLLEGLAHGETIGAAVARLPLDELEAMLEDLELTSLRLDS